MWLSSWRRWATRGSRHFDAHAYRTADVNDVKEFCQRLHAHLSHLKDKAQQFELIVKSRRCWPKSKPMMAR